MTPAANVDRNPPPLRLWPGIIAVILQWLLWLGLPMVAPDLGGYGILGGIAGGALVILIWWLFFSRAAWIERLGALALIAIAVFATPRILDKSITNGMMGMMFPILSIPAISLALVVWAVLFGRLSAAYRRAALALTIFAGCGAWGLMRTDGITGEGRSQLAWRWKPTAEQKLLSGPAAEPAASTTTPSSEKIAEEPTTTPVVSSPVAARAIPAILTTSKPVSHTPILWPGFRGPNRDDAVTGVRIKTDWTASPPAKLWERQVGPGWSSFALSDDFVYTQEQRGDFEAVTCYEKSTGKPVWVHRDRARFWESNAGAGPRGTPTLHEGLVYTFGATGILNALDASDGRVIWARNAAHDTGTKTPGWGYASSPLVVGDLVIVGASARLIAYDLANGQQRWVGPVDGDVSYSSPHLLTIAGVPQVVFMDGENAIGVSPADGKILWKHSWPGFASLQPALTSDGGVLITAGDMSGGMGTRRLAITQGPSGWTAQAQWTSTGLKPYFNDIVVHDGHAYGFDNSILSCIDLADGKRKWKGGRYGHGQLLLLADQDLLLVTTEEGEIALVSATPGEFKEIARTAGIEGKTWNHPVLAGDILLVRNSEQMAAFRLATGN